MTMAPLDADPEHVRSDVGNAFDVDIVDEFAKANCLTVKYQPVTYSAAVPSVQNQRIDIAQGAFSNVGGLTGNVAVAWGAIIENAIGSDSRSDTIIGNSANNTLTGGSALTPASAEVLLTAHSFITDAGSFGAESCGVDRCVRPDRRTRARRFRRTVARAVGERHRARLFASALVPDEGSALAQRGRAQGGSAARTRELGTTPRGWA